MKQVKPDTHSVFVEQEPSHSSHGFATEHSSGLMVRELGGGSSGWPVLTQMSLAYMSIEEPSPVQPVTFSCADLCSHTKLPSQSSSLSPVCKGTDDVNNSN